MKKINLLLSMLAIISIVACSSDDDGPNIPKSTLTLNLNGLEALSDGFEYEGWIMVNGSPVSTGTFTTPSSSQTFRVPTADLEIATAFILSIESDNDPAPSNTKVLSGDFVGNANSATLSLENQVPGILNMGGSFFLATPTDYVVDNDESGVWFMSSPGVAGLTNLPNLGTGWKYEGWVVVDGNVLSTGKFTSATGEDDSSFFSGPNDGPEFPGEDFLATGVPIDGLTFPLDLRNQTVVVSIEPQPDDSASPFSLKPLIGDTGTALGGTNPYSMTLNNASFPSGSVTR
jgi:hypothetical protein